jgi:hypothetical protein
MSPRAFVVAAVLLCVSPYARGADEKKKAGGGDQTQALDSPLPLVGGATVTASKDETSVSVAVNQQVVKHGLFWQAGVAGSATEGSAPVFSRSNGIPSGVSAKVGIGFSSFLAEDNNRYLVQLNEFMTEAWCLDEVSAAAKAMGDAGPDLGDLARETKCGPSYDKVDRALAPWKTKVGAEKAKPLETTLEQVKKVIDSAFKEVKGRFAACKALTKIDWAKAVCSNPNDETLQAATYPALYERVVTAKEKAWRFKVSANWTPSFTSAKYRPVTNGVPDLADEQKWNGFLNGGTIDTTFHYKAFIAGLQFGYADKLDDDAMKPVDVCRRTMQGDYYYDDCKKSVIGKPEPFANPTVGAVLALDPLIPSVGDTSFRPGAQIAAKWERIAEGKKRLSVSIPIYLARADSPLDFVFGIKPAYEWNRGTKKSENFAVSAFIGARP